MLHSENDNQYNAYLFKKKQIISRNGDIFTFLKGNVYENSSQTNQRAQR